MIFQEIEDRKHEFDAVVIVRGGGDKSDLDKLNILDLARSICSCPVPVFTGLGHDTDSTILDEVAHSKFLTPTAVGESISSSLNKNIREFKDNWATVIKKRMVPGRN